jgi:hypothetical protein
VNAVLSARRTAPSVRSLQISRPITGVVTRRPAKLSPRNASTRGPTRNASARGPVSISAIAATRSRRCSASDVATAPPVECPTTVTRRSPS